MDIKIITCHDVYNYGASLQAYALMHFLENNRHQATIIDYLPEYKHGKYDYHLEKKGLFGRLAVVFPLFKPLLSRLRYRSLWKFMGRKTAFDIFKKDCLQITLHRYSTLQDFNLHPLRADLFIAGSDQIWNPNYGNGKDPVYYCGFVDENTRCISYAASFGVEYLEQEEQLVAKKLLQRFDVLSIREMSGVELAKKLGFESINVCDPVFLLSTDDWETICRRHIDYKYLLIYDFKNDNPRLKQAAMLLAKEKNLKIISINDDITIPYADLNINNAGPIEFIEYIRDAEFVISSSFHATAFSVMFKKEFLAFPLIGHKNDSRMVDFLSMLGIADRFNPGEIQNIVETQIDYSIVDERLQVFISSSKKWLLNNISKQ